MIRFLLFAVVFYYLFKFLSKVFGVFLFKKAQQQYSNQGNTNSNGQKKTRKGDVEITFNPKDDKKHVKGGDYVEFEEVD